MRSRREIEVAVSKTGLSGGDRLIVELLLDIREILRMQFGTPKEEAAQ